MYCVHLSCFWVKLQENCAYVERLYRNRNTDRALTWDFMQRHCDPATNTTQPTKDLWDNFFAICARAHLFDAGVGHHIGVLHNRFSNVTEHSAINYYRGNPVNVCVRPSTHPRRGYQYHSLKLTEPWLSHHINYSLLKGLRCGCLPARKTMVLIYRHSWITMSSWPKWVGTTWHDVVKLNSN